MADRNGALVYQFPNNERQCFICKDTTDFHIHKCANPECPHWHCITHSSKNDPQFCEHCLIDITITESTYVRTEEEYDETTDTVITKTTRPSIKREYTGVDWVFYQNYFRNQTDQDLRHTLQLYKAAVSLMENELTQRKINKLAVIRLNDTTISTSTSTTKVKKTKVAKPVDLQALMDMMKKMNLSMDDVKKMMGIK